MERFIVKLDGQPDTEYDSMVEAMSYIESHENPPGSINYDGLAVVVYVDGQIDLAS
jgi:hypothetical protein